MRARGPLVLLSLLAVIIGYGAIAPASPLALSWAGIVPAGASHTYASSTVEPRQPTGEPTSSAVGPTLPPAFVARASEKPVPQPASTVVPRQERPTARPSQVARATPSPKPTQPPVRYSGRSRLWIPALGMSQPIYTWGCKGGVLPNRVYRWTCAGKNNLDLLGHAWGVFAPVHDYYVRHHTMPRALVMYVADATGRVRRYKLAWVKVVNEASLQSGADHWMIARASARPVVTLETCIGQGNIKRLVLRFTLTAHA